MEGLGESSPRDIDRYDDGHDHGYDRGFSLQSAALVLTDDDEEEEGQRGSYLQDLHLNDLLVTDIDSGYNSINPFSISNLELVSNRPSSEFHLIKSLNIEVR